MPDTSHPATTSDANEAKDQIQIEDLPALLKQLDEAAEVTSGVESKLDGLIAKIEALEKSYGIQPDENVEENDFDSKAKK